MRRNRAMSRPSKIPPAATTGMWGVKEFATSTTPTTISSSVATDLSAMLSAE